MKYSKIIKENFQNKFTYLMVVLFSITLFSLLCFGSINLHLITSWFSGGTNIEEAEYTVIYYANMPEGVFTAVKFKIHGTQSMHIITDNEFGTPSGYEFVGWNTEQYGSGTMYYKDDVLNLVTNVVLYAQWRNVDNINPDDDLDLPDDDIVDDELTDDNENLEEDNSNNNDGSDTNDSTNDSTNDDVENDNLDDSGDNSSNNMGNGGGGSGSSNGGNSSSNTGTTNNSNNKEPPKTNDNVGSNNNVENDKDLPKNYNFKFYKKNILFSTTSCKVSSDKTCMLVFPDNEPVVDGYTFLGWSLTSFCDNDIITESILVNSDRNYYACYEINENVEKRDNKIIYYIISIWIIAGVAIYFVIKKFRKNNVNIEND